MGKLEVEIKSLKKVQEQSYKLEDQENRDRRKKFKDTRCT